MAEIQRRMDGMEVMEWKTSQQQVAADDELQPKSTHGRAWRAAFSSVAAQIQTFQERVQTESDKLTVADLKLLAKNINNNFWLLDTMKTQAWKKQQTPAWKKQQKLVKQKKKMTFDRQRTNQRMKKRQNRKQKA